MRYLSLFVIVFILFVSVSSAQKKKDKFDWKTGKISAIEFKVNTITYKCEDGGINGICYTRNDKESAMLETEDALYSISRILGFVWQKKLKFNENDNVKYAFYKNSIYLRDTKGNKVEFQIVEKVLK